MFQKRGVEEKLASMPDKKRFKADLCDAFLSNEISATRADRLLRNAEIAGVSNVSDLTKSFRARPSSKGNVSRNLRRRMMKHSRWPKPYYALIDCLDPNTGCEKKMWVPLWLPHEVVHCLGAASRNGGLCLAELFFCILSWSGVVNLGVIYLI